MIVASLTMLRSADLPPIPESFFKPERVTEKKYRHLPEGTVVCLEHCYHSRDTSNPEGVWGFIHRAAGGSIFVTWGYGQRNVYLGGELCTFEEFMSEHGNALPFSWRA